MTVMHFTGDTHGEHGRFDELYRQGEGTWGKDDILFVAGDFGYVFRDNAIERLFLNELEKKPYTICFCDGNHENFPALFTYPCETWNGGKVHRIRQNILHLMRGQVYTIDGKKLFTMGGAYSIDRYMRSEGYSYWREELPSDADYDEALRNLKAHGYRVDYILTHTAPTNTILTMLTQTKDMNGEQYRRITNAVDFPLTNFFQWVAENVQYKQWFFGHWHTDLEVDEKHRALMFDLVTR